jgi:ATP-binding cassette, subfamily B, heavy metal transporter
MASKKTPKKRKINFKYNLNEYFNFLKKYKTQVLGLLFIAIVVESLFVVDKFLFKKLVDDGEMFVAGTLTKSAYVDVLIIIAIIFIGILILRALGKFLTETVLIRLEGSLIKDVKKKYFDHIVGLSHDFHTTHKTGSLISRLGRGGHAIEGMTDILVYNFSPLILQLILVSISLALFTLIPAIVLFFVAVVFIWFSYSIQQKQQSSKLLHVEAEDIEKGLVADIFTNIDSIKYFGKERRIIKRFERALDLTRGRLIINYNYFRWTASGQMLILGLGTFFLIYFPIKQFLAGEITLGTVVFVFTIYGNIAGNLFSFVWGMRGFYRVMADFQDLFEYGKKNNDIKDKKNAKELEVQNGEIEFKNVDFSYGKRKLFKNFNLKIKPNEKVALVGHSGCGKTTLVKIFNRFYDVNDGNIMIDGEDIREFKQVSLRGETGIVPQECILFDDTVYNNIKFANPTATRKEVTKAIRLAQLDEVIKGFPKKENTIVGERGVKLSGGEKQRVSIARAILANKKILVLDEATSALDSETEVKIQKALSNLLQGRTSIIIAHRLSTIMNSDRIVVLRKGKIIEQGSHNELIRRNGEYKKLWNLQKGGYVGD